MTPADIERLSREYAAGEPREGRLARALQVDVPVWRELGNAVLADLDEGVFGVGWWAPYPGTSRRILLGDHLFTCVRSVETNLVEARLHLMEATDYWERENALHARAVSLAEDGKVEVRLPERRRPIDEVSLAMPIVHTVGVIRAVAGALDCFGAAVVGVAATQRRVELHGCTVNEIKNGKSVHTWVYWDSRHLFRQLGVLPGPAQAGATG